MNIEEKVTSEVNGIQRKLIYNNNIILVEKNDFLTFDIKTSIIEMEFVLKFIFSDEGEKYKVSSKSEDGGKTLIITLHNWYSTNGRFVHTTQPWIIPTKSGKYKIYIHCRTIAEKGESYSRSFHVSLWAEEVKHEN
jgi:hypothetical protein